MRSHHPGSDTDNTANNDGAFFCTASSGTTITLLNTNGLAETSGGSPTCVSSANTCVYTWGTTIPGYNTHEFAGQSFTISGFANAGNNGTFIWIITEADRSSTCILLPEEY